MERKVTESMGGRDTPVVRIDDVSGSRLDIVATIRARGRAPLCAREREVVAHVRRVARHYERAADRARVREDGFGPERGWGYGVGDGVEEPVSGGVGGEYIGVVASALCTGVEIGSAGTEEDEGAYAH